MNWCFAATRRAHHLVSYKDARIYILEHGYADDLPFGQLILNQTKKLDLSDNFTSCGGFSKYVSVSLRRTCLTLVPVQHL